MAETVLPQELQDAGWIVAEDGKSIGKTFKFKTFRDALAWMVRAGFEAEAMDHHPDWTNVYNRVEVRLTTHDKGGLTDKDLELARRMQRMAPT